MYRAYTREITNEHTHNNILFYYVQCVYTRIVFRFDPLVRVYWTYVLLLARLKRHRRVGIL